MDLVSVKTIKNLLSAHGAAPSKGLGQNFLVDETDLGKIVEAIDIQPNDVILEIGPGLGVLTQELAKKAKKVVAVEKDTKMVEILSETLKEYKNVEVIQEDIRKFDFRALRRSDLLSNLSGGRTSQISGRFKVVGNLPFYLTAPVIRQFLEWLEARPLTMVFVIQKEVAQRICAKVPDMNLLAVSVQFYAEPKIISYIPKSSFWPVPEVDAAILKITNHKSQITNIDRDLFFKIVKAGFSQPRKQLINNLSNNLKMDKEQAGEWLLKNNIQPSQRAETLTIDNWIRLTQSLVSNTIETNL